MTDNYWEVAKLLPSLGKFCFTGDPEYGVSRDACKARVKELGMKCSDAKCDVVVQCGGRNQWSGAGPSKKLQTALDRRVAGETIVILSEVDFLKHFGFSTPTLDAHVRAFDTDVPFEFDTTELEEAPF